MANKWYMPKVVLNCSRCRLSLLLSRSVSEHFFLSHLCFFVASFVLGVCLNLLVVFLLRHFRLSSRRPGGKPTTSSLDGPSRVSAPLPPISSRIYSVAGGKARRLRAGLSPPAGDRRLHPPLRGKERGAQDRGRKVDREGLLGGRRATKRGDK